MKDLSVSKRLGGHVYELFSIVYNKNSGTRGVIVGYSGVSGSESYRVKFDGDPGYSAAMPFRYVSATEVSDSEVSLSMSVDDLLGKFDRGEHLLNREIAFLVDAGVAEYTYNDPNSNGPDGFTVHRGQTGDGNPYLDQVGIEENAHLWRL